GGGVRGRSRSGDGEDGGRHRQADGRGQAGSHATSPCRSGATGPPTRRKSTRTGPENRPGGGAGGGGRTRWRGARGGTDSVVRGPGGRTQWRGARGDGLSGAGPGGRTPWRGARG